MEALAKLRRSAPHLEFPALHKELFSVDGSWSEEEEMAKESAAVAATATKTIVIASAVVSLVGRYCWACTHNSITYYNIEQ